MAFKLVNRSFSLEANYFNVSIFREIWFLSEQILNQEDIDPTKSFFSPNLVHLSNDHFQLLIQPSKIEITLSTEAKLEELQIIGKMTNKLPHIPYSSCEVNFEYLIDDFDNKHASSLFFNGDNKLFHEFNDENDKPVFGAYLSKNFEKSRVQLEIKPARAIDKDDQLEKDYLYSKVRFYNNLQQENHQEVIQHSVNNIQSFFNYSGLLITKIV